MAKRKYTTEDIKNHLQVLGLNWLNKIVYDTTSATYRKFKESDYRKHSIILYLQNPMGANFSALCEISETSFIVTVGSSKLDDSNGWQDYLNDISIKVLP